MVIHDSRWELKVLRSVVRHIAAKLVSPHHRSVSIRESIRIIKMTSLPITLTACLTGCVTEEQLTKVSTDRNQWKRHSRILEGENKELRGVLDEWIQAHNVLQKQVKKLSAPKPPVMPKVDQKEHNTLKLQLQQYENEKEKLEGEFQTLKEDRDAYRKHYKIYKQRYQKAIRRAQRLQRKSKVYERIVKNLETEVEQGQLKLQEVEGRLTVSVIDKIVFKPGGVEISSEGKKVLKKLAELLKGLSGKRIQVEGHTDSLSVHPTAGHRYRNNWELSTLRAAAVVRYLQTAGGVDPTLLSAVGYGPFQPIASNNTAKGRRKNRRIEIVLTPLPNRSIGQKTSNNNNTPVGQPKKK